jgi:hypothetical protein
MPNRTVTPTDLRRQADQIRQFARGLRDGDPAVQDLTELAEQLEARAAAMEGSKKG